MNDPHAEPTISIVVATYNSQQHLRQCLESVTCQDLRGRIQLLVIDGESTDGTQTMLAELSAAIDVCVVERDSGIYDAWNKALKLIRGEWVLFLGSDDYLSGNTVFSECIRKLSSIDGRVDKLVFGNLISVGLDGAKTPMRHDWSWYGPRVASGRRFIPHPSTLHHRSLFEEFGDFDTSYVVAGDYALLLKFLRHHDPVYIDVDITCMRKGGLSNASSGLWSVWLESRRARLESGYGVLHPYFIGKGLKFFLLKLFSRWTR